MKGTWPRRLLALLPPLVLLVLLLLAWQAAVWLNDWKVFLIPSPVDVVKVIGKNLEKLASATLLTAAGALAGFLGSLVLGVATALVFSQSKLVRASCFPYAVFLQTLSLIHI